MKRFYSLPLWLPYKIRKAVVTLIIESGILRAFSRLRYHGLDIPLNLNVLSPAILKAFLIGNYEVVEITHLPSFLKENDRVLELGSGLGVVASVIAKKLPNIRYLGFEADQAVAAACNQIAALNGIRLEIRNAMLMHQPANSASPFYRRKSFWASSAEKNQFGHVEQLSVPTQDFDVILTEYKPTAIICDIEGGEFDLLTSVNLSSVQRLVFEMHPVILGKTKCSAIESSLQSYGLKKQNNLCKNNVQFWLR